MKSDNVFYYCDIETKDGLNGGQFAVGCISHKTYPNVKNSKIDSDFFYDADKMAEFILPKAYPRSRFYFHNMSFDVRFINEYCRMNNLNLPSPIMRNSDYICQPYICTEDEEKMVKVMDTYCMVSKPLEDFPKIFNLQYEKVALDFNKVKFEGNEKLYEERCKIDTEILLRGMDVFYDIFPFARRHYTLAQSSISEFTKMTDRYQFSTWREGQKIKISDLEALSRDGYYGGRCEVFDFNMKDKVYCYDVNSLYPSVMIDNEYPISISHNPNKSVLKHNLYYVHAKVKLPACYIPALPMKVSFGISKRRNKLHGEKVNGVMNKSLAKTILMKRGKSFYPEYDYKTIIDNLMDDYDPKNHFDEQMREMLRGHPEYSVFRKLFISKERDYQDEYDDYYGETANKIISNKGKLIFGIGMLEGWFYSPEFNIIKDIADSYEILDGYSFEGEEIFNEFIDKYWRMRKKFKEENNPIEKVVKLYMNSLYGKFAQKRERINYEYIFDFEKAKDLIEKGEMEDINLDIEQTYFRREVKSFTESRKINPYISGFITSYSRAKLYEYLLKNGEDSLYCDTDSIFTTKQLNNVGDGLGQFKLEHIGRFKPLCCKIYFFCTDKGLSLHKAKGIDKRNIIKTENYDDFVYNIWYNYSELFAKATESMKRFNSFLGVKQVFKDLSLKYDKRQIMDDLTTQPLVF